MKTSYLFFVLGIISMSSCYKDTNNYFQSEVNLLNITVDQDTFVVEQAQVLTVDPKVSSTLNPVATYEYEWKIFSPKTKEVVLGTEKKLSETINVSPGTYSLLFTATDKKTNIRSYKKMSLTVNSTLYNGYYVASNSNAKGSLDFVRTDGKVFFDVEKNFSQLDLTEPIYKVQTAVNKSLRVVYLATQHNIYRFNADDLFMNGNTKSLFFGQVNASSDFGFGMSYYKFGNFAIGLYVINAGQVYAGAGPDYVNGSPGNFSDPLTFEKPYRIFPFVATAYLLGYYESSIFYDNISKKFLYVDDLGRDLKDLPKNPANQFDPSQVGKTAIGATVGMNDEVYYIMKDASNGSYSIYTIAQYVAAIGKATQQVDLSQAPEFDKAIYFSAPTDRFSLYYATESKVYLYNMQTGKAKLALQLASGEKIGDLTVHKKAIWEPTEQVGYNKQIVIAVNNNGKGELRFYTIADNGDIELNPAKKYNGFGEIVDIEYRNINN